MIGKMKAIILSALIGLFAFSAFAQSKKGMHFKDGTWVAPTPQSALDAIYSKTRRVDHAVAVLRQTHSEHPNAELDAFADELITIFLEGDHGMSGKAATILSLAGKGHGVGVPYERAKHLFMDIYKENTGTDVVMALSALYGVFDSGGESMIRDMFHNSAKPAEACDPSMYMYNRDGSKADLTTRCPYRHDPWCDAGNILAHNLTSDLKLVSPVPTDPTPDDIFPYCFGWRKRGDKYGITVF